MKYYYQVVEFLKGKKTHIIAALLVLLNLAVGFNLISPAHLTQINIVLSALGLSALRAGISNS